MVEIAQGEFLLATDRVIFSIRRSMKLVLRINQPLRVEAMA